MDSRTAPPNSRALRAALVLAAALLAVGLSSAGARAAARRRFPPTSPHPESVRALGGGPIIVELRAIQFQWDFFAPGTFGGPVITLVAGQTYEFRIYSGDFEFVTDAHGFSGVSAIGLPGGAYLVPEEPPFVYTITPATLGTYDFLCTNFCGSDSGHNGMTGTITVAPGCTPSVTSLSPTWGPTAGGSLVTISGSCFFDGASVTFGGVPATGVVVTGSNTITAAAPAHAAGPVNVIVSQPGSPNVTLTNGFRYGAGGFFTLPPCRVVDTRNAVGALGGPALVAGADRAFTVTGQCGIPVTAKALTANVTVTQPSAQGHIALFPGGIPVSNVSTLNYRPGQTRANNALLPLDGAGRLGVRCAQGSGTTHFFLDVSGYFQ